MLKPTPDQTAYLRLERARAITRLGCAWRGRADCTHRYRNAAGVEVDVPPGRVTCLCGRMATFMGYCDVCADQLD